MTLIQAIAKAREYATALTGATIDAVSKCERDGDGWKVKLDVVESKARLGDDDLLATFEIGMDQAGELVSFERLSRYKRTQSARAV